MNDWWLIDRADGTDETFDDERTARDVYADRVAHGAPPEKIRLVPPDNDGGAQVRRTISESADKITLKAEAKRGESTRDQDKVKLKIKGDDPDETAGRLADTLAALEEHGVAETLRNTQPGDDQ